MNKKIFLFLIIFVFAFIFRFYDLVNTPEGFDQTEAAFGYNAYSVLKSGRDEYGVKFPLILTSVGDYKLAGYMYWEIPFIAVFGLNEFAVRLSAVVASIITLALIYYITFFATKSRRLSLLTLFFTGVAPWHILLSRMGYDPILAFMMYLFSIAFFLSWLKSQKMYLLFLSSFTFCWAMLTYYAIWVVFPFTILFYLLNSYKKVGRKLSLILPFVVIFLSVIFTAKIYLITKGERLNQDSTYQIHAQPILNEQIREDQNQFPIFLSRIFHNKVAVYPHFLLTNLFNNLSFDFLFLTGDKIDRRFYVPFSGVLYLWSSLFIFLGMMYFWRNNKLYPNLIILGSIIIIFLGSAFSEFGSETERTLLAVPLFSFLTSYGIWTVIRTLKKSRGLYPVIISTSFLLIINIIYFAHEYFWHTKVHEPWGRAYGMREMITSLPKYKKNYSKIIIPDSSYIFYYFYNQTDPGLAWKESESRLDKKNFVGLNLRSKIGVYYAMPIECPAAGKLNILYVCLGNKIPKNSKIIREIRYRDSQPSFTFIEFTKEELMQEAPQNMNFFGKSTLLSEDESVNWKTESEI